ncbi:helix-turn-helix domain-containing protein [Nocardia sp. NPDC050193]
MTLGLRAPVRLEYNSGRGDALSAWQAGVAEFFPPLRIDPLADGFAGSISGVRAADLQVTEIAGNAHHVARRPGARSLSDGEFVKLSVQLQGTGRVCQGGNETAVSPGSIVVYDFARPYDVVFESEARFVVALLPKRALGLPGGVADDLMGAPLASTEGSAPLVASYLRSLGENLPLLTGASSARVSRLFLDLVSTFLAEQLDNRVASEPGALTAAMLRYIDEHLADPELDAATLAAVHHISVRYLHKLFEPTGVSAGQWIRRRRLERARAELTGRLDLAVSEVAHRCGFTDAGYFGRVFKREYGVTPGRWRENRALLSHRGAR